MNELLGWYGYCNSTNDDHTIEQQQFNNLPSNKMTTPDFTTILSTTTTTATVATMTVSATAAATTVTMTTSSPSNLTQSACQTDANNKRSVRENRNSLSLDDTTNTTITTTTDSMSAIDEMTIMSSPLQMCKERSPSSSAGNNLDRESSLPVSHSGKKVNKIKLDYHFNGMFANCACYYLSLHSLIFRIARRKGELNRQINDPGLRETCFFIFLCCEYVQSANLFHRSIVCGVYENSNKRSFMN